MHEERKIKRMLVLTLLLSLYTVTFGMISALVLIKTCIKFIMAAIVMLYPILFVFSICRRGLENTLDDMSPEIYIKSLIIYVLFDLSLEEFEIYGSDDTEQSSK